MRLFDAILDANHRAVAGDSGASVHVTQFADELPVVALTCIDARLNRFFPGVLGLPEEHFIWLRNAGNIITGPLSSTMRSLTLACAVKGAREIAIIGHTDCQVCKIPTMELLDRLKALGVDRSRLPDNLSDFFGTFGSERQNVIKACDFVRQSPLTGPKIPVHGLLLDIQTGGLEWIVNGYEALAARATPNLPGERAPKAGEAMESLGAFKDFALGEMKFPAGKIGEAAAHIEHQFLQQAEQLGANLEQKIAPAAESVQKMAGQVKQYADKNWPQPPPIRVRPAPLPPKKNPLPPPLRPGANFRRG